MGKQKRRNNKIEGCTGQSKKCNVITEDVFIDVTGINNDCMLYQPCEYPSVYLEDLERCIQRLSEELYELNQRIEEVERLKRAKIGHVSSYLKQTSRYMSMKNRIMGACKSGCEKNPSSKRNYNKKLARLVNEFYHDYDISILSSDGAEYITENRNRYQIYHLLHKLEYVYNIFVANFLEHKISFTKFCNLRPFWILPLPNDSIDKFNYFNMLSMMPQYYW